ncbi:DNA cytosine methyltransferase [Brucella pseudogrignonensis]|uniref:DNA (Cytosine-5)-methyltransferase 1 n=1 Tax=Brucella pseudogrignonensis TaxID=419475 RepID=A0ABU1M4V8_9HYPH|nr:DNA cytosine methyltransferase [Brucella pseudogrignonensis]MDR6431032.1 DNA (cytosine-5)-methyltransferase 1 [Brucella pseudogrignonensis]
MTAYYNEFDPKAAAWLRELIKAGHIAPGDVDERSIVDIRPADLVGYTQCHFFAGIGVWSYALRRAGWPDDRPVWTGSCPCQPFSAAGKGDGFADERHLWPHFHWLIQNCRPAVVFGEQVASKDGLGWLDLVQADLEGSGYASGAVDTCAAGFGAPHIRQRLYWVAYSPGIRRVGRRSGSEGYEPGQIERSERLRDADRLADANSIEQRQRGGAGSAAGEGFRPELGGCSVDIRLADDELQQRPRSTSRGNETRERHEEPAASAGFCSNGRMDNSLSIGRIASGNGNNGKHDGQQLASNGGNGRPGPTNGLWTDADWLHCRDGKWRPVEPGTFPLAHGSAARVGRLRGYGNAIVAPAAQAFIEAYLETELVAVNDNSPFAKAA